MSTVAAPRHDPAAERAEGRAALPRRHRLLGPLGFAAGMGVAVAALRLRDPHVSGSWGACPTLALTHFACPLCGGLRAVNDLGHGDLGAAFSSNAMFIASLPLLFLWWAWVVRMRWRGVGVEWNAPIQRPGVMKVVVILMLVFAVVRNLPFAHFLAP